MASIKSGAACAAAVLLTMATMVAAQPPLPPPGVSSKCSSSMTKMATSMLPAWNFWVSHIPGGSGCLTDCIPSNASNSPKPGTTTNCPCFGAPGNNNMDTGNYIAACSDPHIDGYWLNKNTDIVWGSSGDGHTYTCNGKLCPMYTEAIACMPNDCTASDVALVSAMETKALCSRMTPYNLSSCAVTYALDVEDDDGGDVHETIIEHSKREKDLETLVVALEAAGLVETLSGPGPFTLFAPTNEAFAKLPPATLESLFDPANKAVLVKVLTYHVHAGHIDNSGLLDGVVIKTVEGSNVIVRWEPYPEGLVIQGGTVTNLAKMQKPDVEASNGVAHWIQALLIPPSAIDALIAGEMINIDLLK